jgi:hypothetical protein
VITLEEPGSIANVGATSVPSSKDCALRADVGKVSSTAEGLLALPLVRVMLRELFADTKVRPDSRVGLTKERSILDLTPILDTMSEL